MGSREYTNSGIELVNEMCVSIIRQYIFTACDVCSFYGKKTIDSKIIIVLTKLWLKNPDSVLDYCKRVWEEYSSHERSGIPREKRSDLYFSVLFVKKLVEKYKRTDQKVGELSYIYLASILNYFCLDIVTNLGEKDVLVASKVVEITQNELLGGLSLLIQKTSVIL